MIACEQVIAIRGVVSVHHAAELVAACASALSSPAVAEYFVTAVYICCLHGEANIDTCADAGVVPGLAAAMLSHGADCVGVAAQGCQSLAMLASRSTASADTLVLTDGGLVAILHVLESHARHEKVLRYACMSLFDIASACSPVARSALRASRVSELLLAAKATYPLDGEWTVKSWADLALAALRNADDA